MSKEEFDTSVANLYWSHAIAVSFVTRYLFGQFNKH